MARAARDGTIEVDDLDEDGTPAGDADPDDDPDEDEEGDGDGDPQAGSQRDWTPPSRAEWDKMVAAQKRNNAELARRRQIGKVLQEHQMTADDLRVLLQQQAGGGDGEEGDSNGWGADGEPGGAEADPATPPAPAKTEPTGLTERQIAARVKKAATDAARAARTEAQQEAAQLRGALATVAVEASLRRHAWSGKDLERVLRLIDADQIEIGDDGQITGVDEQVQGLKEEFPDWFKQTRQTNGRRGAADVDGAGRGTPPSRTLSWDQQLVNRWQSGR